jgi:hypothetical protein
MVAAISSMSVKGFLYSLDPGRSIEWGTAFSGLTAREISTRASGYEQMLTWLKNIERQGRLEESDEAPTFFYQPRAGHAFFSRIARRREPQIEGRRILELMRDDRPNFCTVGENAFWGETTFSEKYCVVARLESENSVAPIVKPDILKQEKIKALKFDRPAEADKVVSAAIGRLKIKADSVESVLVKNYLEAAQKIKKSEVDIAAISKPADLFVADYGYVPLESEDFPPQRTTAVIAVNREYGASNPSAVNTFRAKLVSEFDSYEQGKLAYHLASTDSRILRDYWASSLGVSSKSIDNQIDKLKLPFMLD